jgi:hypothetical protein
MSDSPHNVTVPVPECIPVYDLLVLGRFFESHFLSVFAGPLFSFVTVDTLRWDDAHSTVIPRKG